MKLSKINQNSLEETISLINEIKNRIKDYEHIEKYLPKSLIKQINDFSEKIYTELDNRIY